MTIIIIVINTCKPSNPSSQRMWTVWPDLLSCLHMVLLSTNQRSVLICINQSRVSIFTCQDQLPDLSFLLFSLQQENASVLTLLKWWVKMTKLLSSNQIKFLFVDPFSPHNLWIIIPLIVESSESVITRDDLGELLHYTWNLSNKHRQMTTVNVSHRSFYYQLVWVIQKLWGFIS